MHFSFYLIFHLISKEKTREHIKQWLSLKRKSESHIDKTDCASSISDCVCEKTIFTVTGES